MCNLVEKPKILKSSKGTVYCVLLNSNSDIDLDNLQTKPHSGYMTTNLIYSIDILSSSMLLHVYFMH